MKSIVRIRKNQPNPKKKVVELDVGGRIGRWFCDRNWGASTIPWPFFTTILYWSDADVPDGNVDPYIRVHEFVHVKQNEADLFFGVSWVRYFLETVRHLSWKAICTVGVSQAILESYYANRFEAEAYAVEDLAERNGLPDWAK